MRDRIALAAFMTVCMVFGARAAGCQPGTPTSATIGAVIDGRTVRLADGRDLRLAGIDVPQDGAKQMLEALAGREVNLYRLDAEADRYGRVVALVAPKSGTGIENSVQIALLARGLARVSGPVGDTGCAAELLRIENLARRAGLGLWSDPHYLIKNSQDPAGILAVRGQFTVVEGEVVSVRESGGTVYVNFGRRWSDDFTVTVPKRRERSFMAAGMELKKLAGQHVRVRGVVEERGGPWIEATAPGQIEIAERN